GKPRWSAIPGFDEGGADALCIGFLVPVRRQGKVVGVVTVDLFLDAFFGATGPLGDWTGKVRSEHRQGSYGFVISHTVTHWDPGKEITEAQRLRGERGWGGEPGTGAFVNHPEYRFPLRIKDLPARPRDFDDLAGRILRRDEKGNLIETSGIGTATDPHT